MIFILNDAIEVLKKIEDNNFKAYIVGGFVRDFYMNHENSDVDICTSATELDLKNIFGEQITTSQYGSFVLNYKDKRYEITTFRKEAGYIDSRHPKKIKFVKNLKTDLKRRDFTMNTICLTSDLNYIDYYKGRDDINNHLIKMVGNPKKRLKEDSLRILRAIRFATTLNFEIDENLKIYIKQYGYLLSNLSYFYKRKELEKIFLSPNIKRGIDLILEFGLEKHLELKNLDKLIITPSLMGIWCQLGVIDTYSFSNAEKYIITSVNKLNDKDLFDNHVIYNNNLTILKIAAEVKNIDTNLIEEKYNSLPIHNSSEINFDLNSLKDIVNKKYDIGDIIKDIEHLILSNRLENKNEIILSYINLKYK